MTKSLNQKIFRLVREKLNELETKSLQLENFTNLILHNNKLQCSKSRGTNSAGQLTKTIDE